MFWHRDDTAPLCHQCGRRLRPVTVVPLVLPEADQALSADWYCDNRDDHKPEITIYYVNKYDTAKPRSQAEV